MGHDKVPPDYVTHLDYIAGIYHLSVVVQLVQWVILIQWCFQFHVQLYLYNRVPLDMSYTLNISLPRLYNYIFSCDVTLVPPLGWKYLDYYLKCVYFDQITVYEINK